MVERANMSGVLVNELAGLGIVQVDCETVVVVGSIAPSVPSELPELVSSNPLGDGGLLPLPDDFKTCVVRNLAEVFETLIWGQPTVLLKDNRLVGSATGSSVVLDPLCSPLWSLAPPIWVEMEGTVVDSWDVEFGVEVSTIGTVVSPVGIIGVVESTLATDGNHVVGVERLDEGGDFDEPGVKLGWVAIRGSWKIAGSVGAAAGFVTELPREDGLGMLVSLDDNLDVVLELGDDVWLDVELFAS